MLFTLQLLKIEVEVVVLLSVRLSVNPLQYNMIMVSYSYLLGCLMRRIIPFVNNKKLTIEHLYNLPVFFVGLQFLCFATFHLSSLFYILVRGKIKWDIIS